MIKNITLFFFSACISLFIGLLTVFFCNNPVNVLTNNMKFFIFFTILIFCCSFYHFIFKVRDILAPIYLFSLCFLIFFGVPVYSNLYISDKYFLIICFSYITFFAGIILGEIFSFKLKKAERIIHWDLDRVFFLGRIMFFISLITYLLYIKIYGIAILSSNIDAARTLAINGDTGGYFNAFSSYFFYPVAITFFAYTIDKNTSSKNKTAMIIYILVCILISIGTGVRSGFTMILLSCLLIYHYLKEQLKIKTISIITFFTLLGISLIQIIRFNQELSFKQLLNRLFIELEVIALNLSLILDRYSPDDFIGIKSLFMGLSVVLPGRQLDLSMHIKEYLHLDFSGGGVTPTIIGGFYIGFGNLGVYVGMTLFGLVSSLVYKYMINQKDVYHTILYAVITVYNILSLRNGALYGAISFSYVILFVILNTLFVIPKKTTHPAL